LRAWLLVLLRAELFVYPGRLLILECWLFTLLVSWLFVDQYDCFGKRTDQRTVN
jgi:hypothetical protein